MGNMVQMQGQDLDTNNKKRLKVLSKWKKLCKPRGVPVTFDENVREAFLEEVACELCLRHAEKRLAAWPDGAW